MQGSAEWGCWEVQGAAEGGCWEVGQPREDNLATSVDGRGGGTGAEDGRKHG